MRIWNTTLNSDVYHHYMRPLLKTQGIMHKYEEFPDDHSAVNYRMDRNFPMLAKAVSESHGCYELTCSIDCVGLTGRSGAIRSIVYCSR